MMWEVTSAQSDEKKLSMLHSRLQGVASNAVLTSAEICICLRNLRPKPR